MGLVDLGTGISRPVCVHVAGVGVMGDGWLMMQAILIPLGLTYGWTLGARLERRGVTRGLGGWRTMMEIGVVSVLIAVFARWVSGWEWV